MLFRETKKAALEAVLFVAVESLTLKELADVLDLSEEDVEGMLAELMAEYQTGAHGIRIAHVAEGYRFVTKDAYADEVERILKPHVSRLSRAALETLSIIAYRQPITRAEIERIRGVNVDRVLARLMEKELVYEVGRKETPGRPILYGTTPAFLEYFGLESLESLPELKPATEEEIADDLQRWQEKQQSMDDKEDPQETDEE